MLDRNASRSRGYRRWILLSELEQDVTVLDEARQLVDRLDDAGTELLLLHPLLRALLIVPESGLGHPVLDVSQLAVAAFVVKDSP